MNTAKALSNQLWLWLRLIRWRNLLILLFTQWAAWQTVFVPCYQPGVSLLQPPYFWMLALSTVCIAAAGYIINDYQDVEIDRINKPQELIIDSYITGSIALLAYVFLNICGLLLSFLVAQAGGHTEWLLLQVSCIVLLYGYSRTLKQRFLWGNLTIALLTALTLFTLWLYEPGMRMWMHQPALLEKAGDDLPNPVALLAVYGAFAFLLTWMRELVKDMEDKTGDAAQGCYTMPIMWGLRKSSRFVQFLGALTILLLATVIASLLLKSKASLLGWYALLLLLLPLSVWTFTFNTKTTPTHYGQYSRYLKLMMLAGIGSLFVYRFYYG